jgi:hypothetical protein
MSKPGTVAGWGCAAERDSTDGGAAQAISPGNARSVPELQGRIGAMELKDFCWLIVAPPSFVCRTG